MALAMRNSYGETPLDMARRQVEKRVGGVGGATAEMQIKTHDWIAERIGVPKWAAVKQQQSGVVRGPAVPVPLPMPMPVQGRALEAAQGAAIGAAQAYFAQFHQAPFARASVPLPLSSAFPPAVQAPLPLPARGAAVSSPQVVSAPAEQRPVQVSASPSAPAVPVHPDAAQATSIQGSVQGSGLGSAQTSATSSAVGSGQGAPA
ncbi:hypothetical protein BCR44DRAFT_55401 [Catenaria anguillulae PL171]|uniref:Uncharacterized protein n=1 Tax=Catenaria anguillulae PL171 TaxID=765915 RepID=A0A1Y2HXQ9_9FUNG|nr:hypothetical protein BCR44DRAFT_55401 [Catenaria anguillulae PL171]